MGLKLSITIDKEAFENSVDRVRDRFDQAFPVAANMIASMIRTQSIADIQSAGSFGSKFVDALKVEVNGNTITTSLDAPGASVFETGGVIHGRPLMWIPISGTNAVGIRASDYPGGLFSVNRKAGGRPLLFSVAERAPRYFGIASVTMPKKFHFGEIQKSVMERFKDVFETALGAVNG